ncbi:hypothetical protein [uncultured Roseibium sp.]|uniref:hypothetical protein n=1 Tax=uncultured Roseibium sp. TaxID=1936171 RepID=UPI002597E6A9|nr:hypothetical protein [uncultured Roseibium sp.]
MEKKQRRDKVEQQNPNAFDFARMPTKRSKLPIDVIEILLCAQHIPAMGESRGNVLKLYDFVSSLLKPHGGVRRKR